MPGFQFPNGHPFYISDELWAPVSGFKPTTRSYSFTRADGVLLVRIDAIEPPYPHSRQHHGPDGFEEPRMLDVLRGIASSVTLDSIDVITTPKGYKLKDGFHRLHASVAFGYTHIPAIDRSWEPEPRD